MKKTLSYKVAFLGMLFALAIALSVLESFIAGFLPFLPGVKLGLANVVIMYALLLLSKKQAFALAILKAGFSFLTRGAVAGALSLTGGLVSFVVMALIMKKKSTGLGLIAVLGAVAHNIGQFLVVAFLFGTKVFVYLPILIISGIIMGLLTAAILKILLPALKNIGISSTKDE